MSINKLKTTEEKYKKMSQVEHVLELPDTSIQFFPDEVPELFFERLSSFRIEFILILKSDISIIINYLIKIRV